MEIMAAHAAAPTTFRQGDRCVVNAANAGTVQFVGRLPALGPGLWVGVLFDEPAGKDNGRLPDGKLIFRAPRGHGGFHPLREVELDGLWIGSDLRIE